MSYDARKVDEAVLAVLYLTLHDGSRAWKTLDWQAMDRLYEQGLISDPATRAKSILFTDEGVAAAKRAAQKLLA